MRRTPVAQSPPKRPGRRLARAETSRAAGVLTNANPLPSFVFLAAFCATPDDSVRLQNALTDLIQKPLALQQIEESFLKQCPVVAGKTPFFA